MPIIKQPFDTLILLGGGVHASQANNTFPSGPSAARLVHGVEIFNKYGAKYFICSGNGTNKISEADVMAKIALALKVTKEKILIEAKSNNTWEHAVELHKIFVNKNISLGIVTSGNHMKRAKKDFRNYFNNIVSLPASYFYSSCRKNELLRFISQAAVLSTNEIILKEIIGSVWHGIKGVWQIFYFYYLYIKQGSRIYHLLYIVILLNIAAFIS